MKFMSSTSVGAHSPKLPRIEEKKKDHPWSLHMTEPTCPDALVGLVGLRRNENANVIFSPDCLPLKRL